MNKASLLTIIIIMVYTIGFIGITVEPKTEGTIEINGEIYTVVIANEYLHYKVVKLHINNLDEWKLFDYTSSKPKIT